MKKWIKIIAILFFVGAIGAVLGYEFIYNKPHRDFEKAEADFKLSGPELFSAFVNNRSEAEARYNGKVIEISGTLSKVERPDSLTIAVFAFQDGMFGEEGIRCTMLDNHAEKTALLTGREVRIKGFCSGYNETDVIMEKCSIVTN
ncbi:MAG: hypothetical protein JXA03_01190 [Bacteroidales bacterium]|nr:hypothetical protein [Bacteroidales bacterium]